MKLVELLVIPTGTTLFVLNEFGNLSKKVAVWDEEEVKKCSLITTLPLQENHIQIIHNLYHDINTTDNFINWYDNSGFDNYPEDDKECAPGNINFSFLEIEPWQILGLYLGEIALMTKGPNRIEVLVKILTSKGTKWVHYQCSDVNDDLVIS